MLTRKVKHYISKLSNQQGGVMISFAVLLPLLLIVIALVVNSLKMFISKSKISDVSAEIGLMVSATSSVTESSEPSAELKALVVNYVKEFFPDSTKPPLITVNSSQVGNENNTNSAFMTYQPTIEVELPLPFYDAVLSGGEKNFTLTASPITVKKKVTRPVDIVFVMDFSASQKGSGLRLLKETFKELTEFVVESNPDSRIAMVPFSIGVAVKYPETNQRGGPKGGCSVLFVPKPAAKIDYAFWGDKYIKGSLKTLTDQTYYMDNYRRKYYVDYVAKSTPKISEQLIYNQWCRKNTSSGRATGRDTYSCFDNRILARDPAGNIVYPDDIFSASSLKLITDEYARAAEVKALQDKYYTIEHDDAIDYEATLNKMFTDEAIITFPMLWTNYTNSDYRTFSKMCHNTGYWNNNGQLANAKLYSWLIELTGDIKELAQFQDMNAQGYTATTSGLLRSVPVMMKGRNPRKIFVIMSDGDDTKGSTKGPQTVTDRYLIDYKLCEKIRAGIIDRPETETDRVDIYYVSTTNSTKRVNYWRDNCTGEGNAAMAVNRKDVVALIKGYLSDEIGSFGQEH